MKKLLVVMGLIFLSSTVVRAQSSVQPPNGLSEIAAYSIFLENYKNESYETAIEYGRWMWKGMPQTLEGYSRFDLARNLDRLITAYSGAAEGMADPAKREAYIDTALIIFEKAFTNLKDEIDLYEWHLSRGRFYQQHPNYIDNAEAKAAEDYLAVFKMDTEKLTKTGDGYYVQAILQNLVSEGKKDEALAIIEKAQPYAGSKLSDYFNSVRRQLFNSPEERIAFLKSRIEDNPEDQEIIKELRDLYQEQGMTQEAQKLNKRLYELDPSYENTKALAEAAISNANYDAALRYLKEALNKTQDAEEKARINLQISDVYLNSENLREARTYARQAAQLDSDWGQPYIQTATIYARAVNQCTSGRKMEREDKIVYWLVLDYLDKAKSVDSSVSSLVQRQYQTYEPVAPTTEEKFFEGWETGQEMKIDASLNECYGWINETTTVR